MEPQECSGGVPDAIESHFGQQVALLRTSNAFAEGCSRV